MKKEKRKEKKKRKEKNQNKMSLGRMSTAGVRACHPEVECLGAAAGLIDCTGRAMRSRAIHSELSGSAHLKPSFLL